MPSQMFVAGCVVPILSHLALPYEVGHFREDETIKEMRKAGTMCKSMVLLLCVKRERGKQHGKDSD